MGWFCTTSDLAPSECSRKSDIKRSFGTTAPVNDSWLRTGPAGRLGGWPGPGRAGARRRVTVVVCGAVTPARGEDAAATSLISIAVSRHRRRPTVINKRYAREKRRRLTEIRRRQTDRLTDWLTSVNCCCCWRRRAYHGATRIRHKLLMQMAWPSGRLVSWSSVFYDCSLYVLSAGHDTHDRRCTLPRYRLQFNEDRWTHFGLAQMPPSQSLESRPTDWPWMYPVSRSGQIKVDSAGSV